jgi:hypothetical protein
MPAADLPHWLSVWRPDPRWANAPPVHSGNRALLYARVEHRAWMAAFEAFLQGKRHSPPPLDPSKCRFGIWLKAEMQTAGGKKPIYRTVAAAHHQFHALSAEIFAAQTQGRTAEGFGRLGELQAVSADLLHHLETWD